jgi:hypothetical protein
MKKFLLKVKVYFLLWLFIKPVLKQFPESLLLKDEYDKFLYYFKQEKYLLASYQIQDFLDELIYIIKNN